MSLPQNWGRDSLSVGAIAHRKQKPVPAQRQGWGPPLRQSLTGALAALALVALAGHLAPTSSPALAAPAQLPPSAPDRQIASVTATPRLVLTDTPTPGDPGASSATPSGGSTTTSTPAADSGDTGGAGTALPGTTATATLLGEPALPAAGTPGAAATDGGAGTGPPDSAAAAPPGPAGLLPVPVDDRVILDLWQRYGSPRATQPAMQRLTADRPGPWGWAAFYALLLLAWLWAFWRVWRALGAVGDRA